eukprot:3827301-Rhodomonas_salina.1
MEGTPPPMEGTPPPMEARSVVQPHAVCPVEDLFSLHRASSNVVQSRTYSHSMCQGHIVTLGHAPSYGRTQGLYTSRSTHGAVKTLTPHSHPLCICFFFKDVSSDEGAQRDGARTHTHAYTALSRIPHMYR